jgi:hypothetical protein
MGMKVLSGMHDGDAATETLLTPTSGYRLVIYYINLTADVAGIVKVFDGTNVAAKQIVHANMGVGVPVVFGDPTGAKTPHNDGYHSLAIDNVLGIIGPAGTDVGWTVFYDEVPY